jgi:hypothetical protein
MEDSFVCQDDFLTARDIIRPQKTLDSRLEMQRLDFLENLI